MTQFESGRRISLRLTTIPEGGRTGDLYGTVVSASEVGLCFRAEADPTQVVFFPWHRVVVVRFLGG